MTSAMTSAISVWLADLTYTQQSRSSDIMPAAIGCLATYVEKFINPAPECRLFKLPEKLIEALENNPAPKIMGFSNYVWNCSLATNFAQTIKKQFPETIIVFGGPNYPSYKASQEDFLHENPMIDFYVVGEGETGLANLLTALKEARFEIAALPDEIASVHWIDSTGHFHASNKADRIRDISIIPSPYTTGKLDEFFDGVFLPIIQTNRGCPFQCTFCVEGMPYYSLVAKKKSANPIFPELNYIAERAARLRDEKGGRGDLHIADSNFGMYKEDLNVCHAIADTQKTHGFPEYVNVATGKNQKARVLEAARIINGALRLSGAVQSLNPDVLENIERNNISADEIIDLALEANTIGANSYSELILGLPGESKESHFNTIKIILSANFRNICLYQLMLLPGTNLGSKESVEKWGMQTKYRIIPRCYGYYDCNGEQINAAEIERIVVANNALSFEDYLDCRRMHFIVNLFYNDSVFDEVLNLLRILDIPKYAWIELIHRYSQNSGFNKLMDKFIDETQGELWSSHESLDTFIKQRENIELFINGDLGANIIFSNRAYGMINYLPDLAAVATATLTDLLAENQVEQSVIDFGAELVRFAQMRMTNIFNDLSEPLSGNFDFDVVNFAQDTEATSLDKYLAVTPRKLEFHLEQNQVRSVTSYLQAYGDTIAGRSRILATVFVGKLLRNPSTQFLEHQA